MIDNSNLGKMNIVYAADDNYAYNERNYYDKDEYEFSVNNPIIIHYSGMAFIRPWFINSNHPRKDDWIQYFEKSPWRDKELKDWPDNKYIIIREWMYRLFPPAINGFISGFFLRHMTKKTFGVNRRKGIK